MSERTLALAWLAAAGVLGLLSGWAAVASGSMLGLVTVGVGAVAGVPLARVLQPQARREADRRRRGVQSRVLLLVPLAVVAGSAVLPRLLRPLGDDVGLALAAGSCAALAISFLLGSRDEDLMRDIAESIRARRRLS